MIRLGEPFRGLLYTPFYLIHALGYYEAEDEDASAWKQRGQSLAVPFALASRYEAVLAAVLPGPFLATRRSIRQAPRRPCPRCASRIQAASGNTALRSRARASTLRPRASRCAYYRRHECGFGVNKSAISVLGTTLLLSPTTLIPLRRPSPNHITTLS